MNLAVGLSFGLFGIVGFLAQVAKAHLSGDLGDKQNSRSGSYAQISDTDIYAFDFDADLRQAHIDSAKQYGLL